MEMNVTVPGIGILTVSAANPLPVENRPLLATDERQKFWLNQDKWPRDGLGKIFLARAVHRLGGSMFEGKWTGFEPSVDDTMRPLPWFASQSPNWEQRAAMQYVPDRTAPPKHMPPSTIHQPDWDRAVALRTATLAAIEGPRERLAHVKARLVEAMLIGELPAFLRLDETGEFSDPLPVNWWNTERTDARFYMCKLNPRQPITHAIAGDGFRWLFVDGDALERMASPSDPEKDDGNANTIPHQKALEAYLMASVGASPERRTLEYKRDIVPWMEENSPSISLRMYREIRKIVLERFPGHKWDS